MWRLVHRMEDGSSQRSYIRMASILCQDGETLSISFLKKYWHGLQIFAIGSLIQSKSDNAPRYQHQDLKSQAQSEDVIIRSTKSSPLVRLQAMLLSAMHAIHSESTARISHISGAIIRFASLHGFHRLVDMRDEESQMKTKVWSCAYMWVSISDKRRTSVVSTNT